MVASSESIVSYASCPLRDPAICNKNLELEIDHLNFQKNNSKIINKIHQGATLKIFLKYLF